MSEIPSPPNIIDATNAWNEQSYEARQEALVKAASQSLLGVTVEHEPLPSGREVGQENIHDFWEQGYVATMPTLADAIHDSQAHPERYSTIIRKRPGDIMSFLYTDGQGSRLATELVMTERDALADLDTFISEVERSAGELGLDQTAQLAGRFKEKVGYLSEADFNFATKVIAESLASYVKADAGNVINLFVDNRSNLIKSRDFVTGRVLDDLQQVLADDPDAASRIITNPEEWRGGEAAKLVVLEDWSMSGTQFKGPVGQAREAAEARGLSELFNQTEVHLLAAPKDRLTGEDFTVRSVFVHDNDEHVHEYSMTGWHSSVDYGFETTVDRMLKDLAEHQRLVKPPHLYNLDRQYRPELDDESLKQIDWGDVSALAREQYDLQAGFDVLKAEKTAVLKRYRSSGDAERAGLGTRLDELESTFRDMYKRRQILDEAVIAHRKKSRTDRDTETIS